MGPHLRRLTPTDLPLLRQFLIEHWGSEHIIARGNSYEPEQLDGFIVEENGEWMGVATFFIHAGECEVISLDSLQEGKGIGTQLIERSMEEARTRKCKRLFLVTTNDNLHALGFYQKRGFEISAIYRGAIHEARKIKPSIPQVGMNGIPLRDEIELEIKL